MIILKKHHCKLSVYASILCVSLLITGTQIGLYRQSATANKKEQINTNKSYVKAVDEYYAKQVGNQDTKVSKSNVKSEDEIQNDRVMILMFHRFTKSDDKPKDKITMRVKDFRTVLEDLYASNFRPVSMNDFLTDNYNIKAGCKPIVLTFDDGIGNQLSLEKGADGKLKAKSDCAVGVLEEMNKKYSDFNLRGVFYLNFDVNFFDGEGTKTERLQYLIDKGFEIGNHTYSHKLLDKASSKEIQNQIGRAQYELEQLLPGYKMQTFALPGGRKVSKKNEPLLLSGEYKGVQYKHEAVVFAAWKPTPAHFSKEYDNTHIMRVEATAVRRAYDQVWWDENQEKARLYVKN